MKKKIGLFELLFSRPVYKGAPESPGEEFLVKANTILVDICKLLITLSTGTVGISISLTKPGSVFNKNILVSGWISEGLSIIFGVLFLYSMVRLYLIWNKAELVDRTSTVLGILQFLTFFLGLVLMGLSSI
ncbi:MAG: hypothetical protein QM802_22360 [Agriterribacter sp.]